MNWLDLVEAIAESDDKWPEFVRVYKRSGHRTIHMIILEAGKDRRQEILDNCNQLGSTYEGADDRLYALDFAPGVDTAPAIEYLDGLKAGNVVDWRINLYE